MKKNELLEAALLGSASALGVNWIYDKELLINESRKGSMIFKEIDHDLYKQAKNGFDVYPNHRVGQLDFMGEVLYLFHMFYDYEKVNTTDRWMEYLFDYFRKENEYDGYIESYGNDFLKRFRVSLDSKKKLNHETDHIDKQLGGLVFLLHLYDEDQSVDKVNDALHFARTLTSYVNITPLTIMLNELIRKIDYGTKKEQALEEVIELGPDVYQNSLNAAIITEDVYDFVDNYAGVACDISQSLPLVFYIVKNSNSWLEGLELNATLGGASSARGLFVSALLSRIYGIPEEYKDKLYYKI